MLRSDARLDVVGLIAMAAAAIMFSGDRVDQAVGPSRGMTRSALPAGSSCSPDSPCCLPRCSSKDFPTTSRVLVLISGIVAYALWFWGLQRLSASAVTFLTLLNPVTAALLGWVVLDQRFNRWQAFGAVLVLISVVLGQPGALDWRRRRSALTSPV